MVCCGNNNGITWQLVNLHQEGGDDPLDFSGFMYVAPFLSDSIKFVKKENAGRCTHVVEYAFQSTCSFTQITSDHGLIAHYEERKRQRMRYRFRKRGFAVSRGTHKQHSMSRIEAVGAKQARPALLLNQLIDSDSTIIRQDQVIKLSPRCDLGNEFASSLSGPAAIPGIGRHASIRFGGTLQPVRQDGMLFNPLFSDYTIDHIANRICIS